MQRSGKVYLMESTFQRKGQVLMNEMRDNRKQVLFGKRLGDAVFSLILLLHIFAFILINSYLYDCTCFIHSNPV